MQIILQVSFKEIETKGNKGKEIDFWYLKKKMKQRGESKRNEHGWHETVSLNNGIIIFKRHP